MKLLTLESGAQYEFSPLCSCSKCVKAQEIMKKLDEDEEGYSIDEVDEEEEDNGDDDSDEDNEDESDSSQEYDENGNLRVKYETSFHYMVKQLGIEPIKKLEKPPVKLQKSKPQIKTTSAKSNPPVYPKWTPKELEK